MRTRVSGFDLAIAVVLAGTAYALLAIGGLARNLDAQLAAVAQDSPLLLTRSSLLPRSGGGTQLVPRAWTLAEAEQLSAAADHLGTLSPLSISRGFLKPHGDAYQRASILSVDSGVLPLLSVRRACTAADVFVAGFPETREAGRPGTLDGRPVTLFPLPDDHTTRLIAAAPDGVVAVVCRGAQSSFAKMIFMPRPGKGVLAQQTLQSAADALTQTGFAPSTVHVQSVAKAMAAQINRDYGWVAPFLRATIAVLFVVFIGFALFDAMRTRNDCRIRRALGAGYGNLVGHCMRRVVRRAGVALLLVACLVLVRLAMADHAGERLGNALAWFAGVYTLAVLAACSVHAVVASAGLDRQLSTGSNAAGNKWNTLAVAVCLASVTAVLTVFATMAFAVTQHVASLAKLDLGYQPGGLFAYQVVPTTEQSRKGVGVVSGLLAEVREATSAHDSATVLCTAPWRLDDFGVRAETRSAAVLVRSGPDTGAILGLSIDGRDFSAADMRSGVAIVVQSVTPHFLDFARLFGQPIGQVQGVHIGALTPERRDMTFKALTDRGCPAPLVILRPAAGAPQDRRATGLGERLNAVLEGFHIGPPVEVAQLVEQARRPLFVLSARVERGLLLVVCAIVLVIAMASAAFVRSRSRVIAIRHALGESMVRAALGATIAVLPFVVGGVAMGVLSLELAMAATSGRPYGIEPLTWVQSGSLAIGLVVLVAALCLAMTYLQLATRNLAAALRTE